MLILDPPLKHENLVDGFGLKAELSNVVLDRARVLDVFGRDQSLGDRPLDQERIG